MDWTGFSSDDDYEDDNDVTFNNNLKYNYAEFRPQKRKRNLDSNDVNDLF